MGEALNQLKKTEPNLEIENAKQIIGFRNRLVHTDDSISLGHSKSLYDKTKKGDTIIKIEKEGYGQGHHGI